MTGQRVDANMNKPLLILAMLMAGLAQNTAGGAHMAATGITLPPPSKMGSISLEEALARRRSVREFTQQPLTLGQISQLLWATQGHSGPQHRTAPSAGATYPLEIYLVVGNTENLPAGLYRYLPEQHRLETVFEGDIRQRLAAAAADQEWIGRAPAVLVIAALPQRTASRYGVRAERYVQLEAGHAAQNTLLQATSLGLGAAPVGAFNDAEVSRLLHLPAGSTPLYIIPVGRPL